MFHYYVGTSINSTEYEMMHFKSHSTCDFVGLTVLPFTVALRNTFSHQACASPALPPVVIMIVIFCISFRLCNV